PEFTDYAMNNRTYRYMKQEALYPFGYGLSYTDFSIDEVVLDTLAITDKGVKISVSLTNTGELYGGETVQIYIKSEQPAAPNPQLKAFKKIHLKPLEKTEIQFELPAEAFALYDDKGIKRLEPGKYTVYIGTSQPDTRSIFLTGTSPKAFCLEAQQEMTW
ncbi:MAG: hypothetical protein K0R05_4853, partial [Anaerocolumna sp.]|nr:hypothetical protein [Anaerocolumna sp.]